MTSENPSLENPEGYKQNAKLGSAILFPIISFFLAILVIISAYILFSQVDVVKFPSSAEGFPILAFFVLGITVGMSQCVWKALPYLLPLLATETHSFSNSPAFINQNQQGLIQTSIAFSLGRLFVYFMYSLSILAIGSLVLQILMDPEESSVLLAASYGLGGLIAFLYAIRRLIHLYRGSCQETCLVTSKYNRYESPFALGAMSSVVPCFPMMLTLWFSFWGFMSSKDILIPILIPLAFSLGTLIPIFAIAVLVLSGRDLLTLGIGPRGIWISQLLSGLITLAVSLFLMISFWLFIL